MRPTEKDTDQGGRSLTVKALAAGLDQLAEFELDFNEAINPPCAYSPYATCPLASKEKSAERRDPCWGEAVRSVNIRLVNRT